MILEVLRPCNRQFSHVQIILWSKGSCFAYVTNPQGFSLLSLNFGVWRVFSYLSMFLEIQGLRMIVLAQLHIPEWLDMLKG